MAKKSTGLGKLLDTIKAKFGIKNDAALARGLEVAAPVISKLRSGTLPLGPSMVIKMHLAYDIPVRELQAAAA